MAKKLPPALTAEQVEAIPHGTFVWVKWSGGNGPWRYRVDRSWRDIPLARTDTEDRLNAPTSRHRVLTDFAGAEEPWTQVWLSDPTALSD